jgi:phosphoglucosamine mutase
VLSFVDVEAIKPLRIVIDAANAMAGAMLPPVLERLPVEAVTCYFEPDGTFPNHEADPLKLENLRDLIAAVKRSGAHFGVAFDGDADRAVFVDDTGEILDGDQVLAIAALDMQEKGILKGNGVVATVMSNLGLELAMQNAGLDVVRAPVGDRYVVEKMLAGNFNLGGEQSGHILFLDHNSTGDGAITCLQMLALMVEKHKRLSELKTVMRRLPQVLLNVKVKEKKDFEQMPKVRHKIGEIERRLAGRGRVLVRYSGTELLARVMLEGEDEKKIRTMAESIADEIRAEVGK